MKQEERLLLAAHNGQADLFFELLQSNTALITQNFLAAKAVCCAANSGYLTLTKRILKHFNMDIDKAYPSGQTLLVSMAKKGRGLGVQTLLEAKANIRRTNFSGDTPLMAAAKAGNTETLQFLKTHINCNLSKE